MPLMLLETLMQIGSFLQNNAWYWDMMEFYMLLMKKRWFTILTKAA